MTSSRKKSEPMRFYVYAMLCQDGPSDPLYIKFGKTTRLGQRLMQLNNGCPIPARYFCSIPLRTQAKMDEVEKALHAQFSGRKVKGEWYRFDSKNRADKEEVNTGCRIVFNSLIPPGHQKWWDKVYAESVIKHQQEAHARLCKSKTGRQMMKRDRYEKTLVPISHRK